MFAKSTATIRHIASATLFVAGVVCISVALKGENLGSDISVPPKACQGSADSGCGEPNMPVLISGEEGSDLALWTTLPGQPASVGVWVRLVDARSGAARGPQVQLSHSVAEHGIVAAYNPGSRRYLLLWQSAGAISGQLLNDRLAAVGARFQIPAHDYYVRPGELAPDPNGGFLFTQAQNGVGLETQTRVFVTQISANGHPLNTVSWPVGNKSQQFQFAEAHAVYLPNLEGYLVAWSLYGTTGSILADRIVDKNLRPLRKAQTIVRERTQLEQTSRLLTSRKAPALE